MNKLKPLLITVLIIVIFLFALRYLNLMPKHPHEQQAMNKFRFLQKNEDAECLTTPCGRSGNRPLMIIFEVSQDKTYGYTSENPIKVGGFSEKDGPYNEMRYLNSLYGPHGEIIRYDREGSCCFFRTPNGIEGIAGLLDRFKITYKGLKEPIFLYLNMYDYEEPMAPYGFTVKTNIKIIRKRLIFKLEEDNK